MSEYTVHFLPADESVKVSEGATIAEAAQAADVFITNLCGGEGGLRQMPGSGHPGPGRGRGACERVLFPGPDHERLCARLSDRNP